MQFRSTTRAALPSLFAGRSQQLLFNVAVQVFGAGLNFVFLPLSAHTLGFEAFGILGIGATVQAWVFVFDGCNAITRVIARESVSVTSSERGGLRLALRAGAERYYLLFSGMGLLPLAVGLVVTRTGSGSQTLSAGVVGGSLVLVAICALAKLLASFYRGCLIGVEDLRGANQIALLAYLVRFPLPYWISVYWPDVRIFLLVQLGSFVMEAFLSRLRFSRLNGHPAVNAATLLSSARQRLSAERKFFVTTFGLAALAVAGSQLDKIILAYALPLGQFGAASLGILLCGGLLVLATPIHQVYLPRMVAGGEAGMHAFGQLMRILCTVCVVAAPASLALAHPLAGLVTAGAGSVQADTAISLALYGIGNSVAMMVGGIYLKYFADGDLHKYRKIMLLYLAFYLPALVIASMSWGLVGAGAAFIVGNSLLLLMQMTERNRQSPGFRVISRLILSTLGAAVALSLVCVETERILVSQELPATVQIAAVLLLDLACVYVFVLLVARQAPAQA